MFEIALMSLIILIIFIILFFKTEIFEYAERVEKAREPVKFAKIIREDRKCPLCPDSSFSLFRITDSKSNDYNVFVGCGNCRTKFQVCYDEHHKLIAKEVGKC